MPKPAVLPIIIVCHKYDVFLTNICVASIRYYYPDVPIYLVKDQINGQFSTKTLEQYFHVKIVHLDTDRFGWGNAKLFLIASKKLPEEKFLVLDSDTVFIGKVFDTLTPLIKQNDFIVSSEYHNKPGEKGFTRWYYERTWAHHQFPELHYPGFTFNSGQMIITPGIINSRDYLPYFNVKKFPYWTKKYAHHFPGDQSLLNILFPIYAHKKRITFSHLSFMKWSESTFVDRKITLTDIMKGKYNYIIHWAGSPRNADVTNMTRGDILNFFENKYYAKIPWWHRLFSTIL